MAAAASQGRSSAPQRSTGSSDRDTGTVPMGMMTWAHTAVSAAKSAPSTMRSVRFPRMRIPPPKFGKLK